MPRLLKNEARRFLTEHEATRRARRVLDGELTYDAELWAGVAELGWIGAAIPEALGGAGVGYEGLCALAEELGRSLAPVPFPPRPIWRPRQSGSRAAMPRSTNGCRR